MTAEAGISPRGSGGQSDALMHLSVGVITVGVKGTLERCLARLTPQIAGRRIDVIVPFDSTMPEVDRLKRLYPDVAWLDLGVIQTREPAGSIAVQHELFERRASAALAAARGDVVAMLQDWGAPDADWCERVLDAHQRLPHAVIGGAVEHESGSLLNWAVYFLDFGRYQLPVTEGPVHYLTDVNVSYKRPALQSVRELWQSRYNEVIVHWTLLDRGETLWSTPRVIVRQDRGPLSWGRLIAERVIWGRIFGGARAHAASRWARWCYIAGSPLIPLVLIGRICRRVVAGGHNRLRFVMSFPVLVVLATAWAIGELIGYVTRRPSPAD